MQTLRNYTLLDYLYVDQAFCKRGYSFSMLAGGSTVDIVPQGAVGDHKGMHISRKDLNFLATISALVKPILGAVFVNDPTLDHALDPEAACSRH